MLVIERGRTRRTHSEQFKQDLVQKAVHPGMSLASVAREHGIHPNLLSRWVKERTGSARRCESPDDLSTPKFVPVHVAPAHRAKPFAPQACSNQFEVNIDRGDVRIQFKVDASQMLELGQVLREVLR